MKLGERVSGELHFPRYTDGCWGKPGKAKCWICKVRAPIKIFKLFWRIRSSDD